MNKVHIPDPIQIRDLTTNEPMSVNGSMEPLAMWQWLAIFVLPDPAMGKGLKAATIKMQILDAFKGGGELEDEWLRRLFGAITEPEGTIPAWVEMQCIPFANEIKRAFKEM